MHYAGARPRVHLPGTVILEDAFGVHVAHAGDHFTH
jgi:hypothetical protein